MYQTVINILSALGNYVILVLGVIWVTIKRPPSWDLIREQLYNMGVLSLPVVAITGFSTGMVLSAQSFFQLSDKGLASATGLMVAKAMIVELGPVLTAFMVTGRVGASICAEIGSMRVTEQIDALVSMSVDPKRYIIAPRFIAGIFMMPLLSVFSSLMGILGGYMVAVNYYKMTPNAFLDPLPSNITDFDIFSGMFKSFMFGIIIVTISCFKGMQTKGGASGVGQSTTSSVVICYSFILIINFLLTIGLNSSYQFIKYFFSQTG